MPHKGSILNLPGFEIVEVLSEHPLRVLVRYLGVVQCPNCGGGALRNKGKFVRRIRHESLGQRSTFLFLESHKYHCNGCGRFFNQRFPGILPYYRSTEGFRREVFRQHKEGISQRSLSHWLHIGTATVERWYKDHLSRYMAERKGAYCPKVLGIDEHFFTHKAGFATTFCDLRRHRIFDIALGRSREELDPYLSGLPGRQQVQVVVMDLAESYRSIVHHYFPQAKIVADRFHVIRLINHHFMTLWRQIDPESSKSYNWIRTFRKHQNNLTLNQQMLLLDYFRKCPAIKPIYEFKQKLCRLLCIKSRTRKQCKLLIPAFLQALKDLKNSGFESLITLANTLEKWSEEVVRMWRFTKTNGITEGFHTKMEMISRRAYGFRNFENYRLRVRALCS